MQPLTAHPSGPLRGQARPPGDKSISHRALMLGASALGETRIAGLLEGEDVLGTAAALRKLGAAIERLADGTWRVQGRGTGGLVEPDDVLDLGNSGTSARLLLGLVATHDMKVFLTGDASLRRRPMGRVIEPLSRMGASFEARQGNRLPLLMRGAALPVPIRYELPVASAQVKSAILLAALNTPGTTTVIEREATRDHSERMLRHLGADVRVKRAGKGAEIAIAGCPELVGKPITVPADPSSAAFAIVAGLTVPGSDVTMQGVGTNPLRTGLFATLKDMGADLTLANARDDGEPIADIVARHSALNGVVVPPERAPSMIDEYPILAVAAAHARGTTVMKGLAELRVKESDRLAAVAAGLEACGVTFRMGEDWLEVDGCAGPPPGLAKAAAIVTHMDHRIAMSFLVLGLGARRPVTVDDGEFIDTSFPGFGDFMRALGADIRATGEVQMAAGGPGAGGSPA
ncbi:MAG: 3-phosphoshikimate 1-carboxyvinyltransferase [Alphaproteobacteria bacterium]